MATTNNAMNYRDHSIRGPQRWRLPLAALAAALSLLAGCAQEMDQQPKYEPMEENRFLKQIEFLRYPAPGTVARGEHGTEPALYDTAYTTGRRDGGLVASIPEPALEGLSMVELLERGQERYRVFCVHCHDLTGSGNGMVPRRGFPYPPSYHSDRLRKKPIGHFYVVITNGFGKMAPHEGLIPVCDRWAIAAYVRALQLSQYAPVSTLPESDFNELPEQNK